MSERDYLEKIDDAVTGPQEDEEVGSVEAAERAHSLLEYLMETKLDEGFTMEGLREALHTGELGEIDDEDILDGVVRDLVAGGFIERTKDVAGDYRVSEDAVRRYNQQRSRSGTLSEEVTEELDEAA